MIAVILSWHPDFSYSQSSNLRSFEYEDILPDFQHMSPEMASLGEYGDIGFDYYTGKATLSIPLFTVRSGIFSLPVSLSYTTGGIHVEEEASSVGLGWVLSCGGHIAHIINGIDDAQDSGAFPGTSYSNLLSKISGITSGMYSESHSVHKTVDWALGTFIGIWEFDEDMNYTDYLERGAVVGALTNRCYVPDIYQASFCGKSLSFSILETGDVVPISSDGRVYAVSFGGTPSAPASITITDDMGISYEFGVKERSGSTTSGFWLTRITTPRKEEISFTYSPNSTLSSSRLFESEAFLISGSSQTGPLTGLRQIFNQDDLTTQICTSIVTENDSVSFIYSSRGDLSGGKRLAAVFCRSSIDSSVKHSAVLHHSNFMPATGDGEITAVVNTTQGTLREGARLRLDSLIVDGKSYKLEYDTVPLPMKTSNSKDFWGIYNGAANGSHILATPKYKISGSLVAPAHYRGYSDRHSSEVFGKAGTLHRITYPTGGSTVIEYEQNTFRDAMYNHYPLSGVRPYDPVNITAASFTGHYGANEATFTITATTEVDISANLHVVDPATQVATGVMVGLDNGYTRTFGTASGDPSFSECATDTLAPGSYKLIAYATPSATSGATSASISASYHVYHAACDSYGGGLRVSALKNFDIDGQTLLGGRSFTYAGGKLFIPTTRLTTLREDHYGGEAYYEVAESAPP